MVICTTILDRIRNNDVSLQKVVLRGKRLKSDDAVLLATSLQGNTSIQHLDLSENAIGVEGIMALSQVLATNETITYFGITSNCIGDEGIIVQDGIASMISQNTCLQELRLSDNAIEALGAMALADALQYNSTIQVLSLGYNNLCNAGATAIANMLSCNETITGIKLNDNGIGMPGAIAITNALQHNTTLQRLWIYGNDFLTNTTAAPGDDDIVEVDDANVMDGDDTNVMEGDAILDSADKLFLDLLENYNTTLTYLNLGYNTIHDYSMGQPVPAASIIRRQKIKQYIVDNKNKNAAVPRKTDSNSFIEATTSDSKQVSKSLVPSKHVKFVDAEIEITHIKDNNGDPKQVVAKSTAPNKNVKFVDEKMEQLQQEIKILRAQNKHYEEQFAIMSLKMNQIDSSTKQAAVSLEQRVTAQQNTKLNAFIQNCMDAFDKERSEMMALIQSNQDMMQSKLEQQECDRDRKDEIRDAQFKSYLQELFQS